jgi:hypothetical protein
MAHQGRYTDRCTCLGVNLNSSTWVYRNIFDRELTHQLRVLSCNATAQTWEQMGVKHLRDKYITHNADDTVLILNHVFVVLPERRLPPQRPQRLDLHKVPRHQGLYWIALMPVVTCVEVLNAWKKWDPDGFLSTMNGERMTHHTERSRRLQRICAQRYSLIIGMNDLSAPWDPGIVTIYESFVPVCVKARKDQYRWNSGDLCMPLLGDKQCSAGAVVSHPMYSLGCTWAVDLGSAHQIELWIWKDKDIEGQHEKTSNRTEIEPSPLLLSCDEG